ncbi:helix-turn-helix domain-containing protein [Methylosinus sp. PW1]|uniref:helix-turn-helix domain-containing protein n=1 Tax=Methylosinus sp. PW1 TaxID=107636 RepID=UPI00068E1737|nr:helix-turn-helix domain-containing protein [Methylosinus sp. PW1]
MPRKAPPRIIDVKVDSRRPWTLRLEWNNGESSRVDVSGHIGAYKLYLPLRRDPELFKAVRLGDLGSDIVWSDEIDMSADTLWRLAQEQAGATMSAGEFKSWRERRAYTLDTAARALGIGRRMISYYEQGEKPIPRVVALATRALDAEGQRLSLKKAEAREGDSARAKARKKA